MNKIVKLVGWGVIYDESWKKGGEMQHSTSCMTTNEAPDGDQYKPCKIDWVIINFLTHEFVQVYECKIKFDVHNFKIPYHLQVASEFDRFQRKVLM